MKFIRLYIKIASGINQWVGNMFSWVVVVLMLLTVFEIIMRRFFNAPTTWSFETCSHLFGLYFMIAAGYTLLRGSHVGVDIIYSSFSKRQQSFIDIISYIIFFFPFNIIMLVYGTRQAMASWETLETSWSIFAPPLYPLKTVIPIAASLLLLQGIAIFIQKIHLALKGEELFYD